MRRRVFISIVVLVGVIVSTRFSQGLGAREQRVGGPPPEIRTLIDDFLKAVNSGSAQQFEAMAQAHYAVALLKKETAKDRAALYDRIRKELGTLSMDRVERQGPDAPLELNVKGSTGTNGIISIETEADAPYRITAINIDARRRNDVSTGDPRPGPAIDAGMSEQALTRGLDAYLSKLAAEDVLSGAALVARDGRAIFQKAYGLANRSAGIANTTAMRFNLGSINKKFTEIAVAQLVASGKLAYDDTVGKFFPAYPQEISRPATLRQLLQHTGGISDFFGEEFSRTAKDRFRSNADYFQLVSHLPALFAPGARNQYCNGCYITLGAIIERVTGSPYEQYVDAHIFRPAGMSSTGYPQIDGIETNIAVGYTRRTGDGSLRSNVFMHGAAGSAAGGGYSTIGDMLAFDNALREGRLLTPDATVALLGGKPAASGRAGGGMGIAGGAPGTNAVLESNGTWTVVVLTNLDPRAGEDTGTAIMRALERRKG
ncbi:MAG TPA: serine hydrolase domain-containing protein [Vicinamibacterales bacterium]|nr:serine hydrolase domain-containing protein [Vicinamibacterales bacterium]